MVFLRLFVLWWFYHMGRPKFHARESTAVIDWQVPFSCPQTWQTWSHEKFRWILRAKVYNVIKKQQINYVLLNTQVYLARAKRKLSSNICHTSILSPLKNDKRISSSLEHWIMISSALTELYFTLWHMEKRGKKSRGDRRQYLNCQKNSWVVNWN